MISPGKSKILLVEDDKVLNQLLAVQLRKLGHDALGVGTWTEAEAHLREHEPDLMLMDVRLPDANGLDLLAKVAAEQPVIVLTAYGTVQDAVSAMKAGAAEYLTKPVDLDELELMVNRVLEHAALREEHQYYKARMREARSPLMVGTSAGLRKVKALVEAVGESDVTVLVQGESGVGKELVAKGIHEHSPRAERNFVVLDCCALQEKLFESELFGHERGAFTGAERQKKGLIEVAAGGTLFLDEVGELDPAIQAKLLRVLETGQFRRVGGIKTLDADVRIVTATNRNLHERSLDGGFRSDLFYRLSAFTISVPPLRERREDIPVLVHHFLRNLDISRRMDKAVTASAMKRLLSYDWPGNVRELRNVVERAVILSRDAHEIRSKHLTFGSSMSDSPMGVTLSFEGEPSLEDIEGQYLEELVAKYSGHRSRIAEILGISERSVYRLLDKHRLKS